MSENHDHCRIEHAAGAIAYEFAYYDGSALQQGALWPGSPGTVRTVGAAPVLMHYAPGRWLAPTPDAGTLSLLAEAQQAGTGIMVEVTGKWDTLRILGPGAARLLACTINWHMVLEERDCAAVTLFDCPAILMRAADGFAIWVQSSYTRQFLSTAEQYRASLEADA